MRTEMENIKALRVNLNRSTHNQWKDEESAAASDSCKRSDHAAWERKRKHKALRVKT